MARAISPLRRCTGGHAFRAPLVVLWLLVMPFTAPRADSFSELEVRAAYLYNFSVFVRWPDSAFEAPDSDFRYCVLGNRQLATTLAGVLKGESVQGRSLRLIQADGPEQWRRCHLMYLDQSAQDLAPQLLSAVKDLPVLTVGETLDLVDEGAMAALARKGRRIKPAIQLERVKSAGIRVSSKLLRLSTLVEGDGP